MTTQPRTPAKDRSETLRAMLTRLRDETYARVRELRGEQEEEADLAPGDTMDAARSAADVETHASLIEQAEQRLMLIDEAMARVEAGAYGRCAGCAREIPVARLSAVPFAVYCIDCQRKRSRGAPRSGEGTMIPPYNHVWTVPEEMAPDREYQVKVSERPRTFAPEVTVEPEPAPAGPSAQAPKRAGRSRKRPARARSKRRG